MCDPMKPAPPVTSAFTDSPRSMCHTDPLPRGRNAYFAKLAPVDAPERKQGRGAQLAGAPRQRLPVVPHSADQATAHFLSLCRSEKKGKLSGALRRRAALGFLFQGLGVK